MGYMGFGMRKEVYARKPKKRFRLWRDQLGPTSASDRMEQGTSEQGMSMLTMREIQRSHRWRLKDYLPTWDRRTIPAAIVAVCVAGIILYVGVTLATAVLDPNHISP